MNSAFGYVLATVISVATSVVVLKPAPTTSIGATVAINLTSAPRSLAFVRLHNGINSGFTKHSEFVIQDADEFTRRWRGVQQGAPGAVLPEVNFEKTTVVFVAIGARNTGGYAVRVDSVTPESNGATVHYTVSSPGARCMSLQELTSPLEVISFDRVEGAVRFKKRNVKGGC